MKTRPFRARRDALTIGAVGLLVTVTFGGQSAAGAPKRGPSPRAATSGVIPDPVVGGWQLNGTAAIVSSSLQLTDATTSYTAGSAFWPAAVPGAGIDAAFDTFIGGGTGADGLTLTLADAAKTNPTALGVKGGGLGYSGIAGVAIALDTFKNAVDPSSNFVGLATGGTHDKLSWAVTDSSVPPLRNTTHHVEVTTTTNHVTVTLDGTVVLNSDVALPPSVLVGFTAADGSTTDLHSIAHAVITAGATTPPPPPGTIPDPVAGGWQLNGTSAIVSSSLQLTDANTTYQAGSAWWPAAVPSAGIDAAFDAFLGGGSGADGLTLTLADGTRTTPTALGVFGGGLGYSGVAGVAVALDTFQNAVNPSGNFVGLASGGIYDKLSWTATNSSVPPLRNTTHHVRVTTATNHVTVTIDGTSVLDSDIALPPSVLVGFTGSDGALTDVHSITNAVIPTPATPAPPPAGSSTYLGGNERTNYFPAETALNAANAVNLKLKWAAHGGLGASTQPIASNGLLYWGDWTGHEHATRPDGSDAWSTTIGSVTDPVCSPPTVGVASSATVAALGSRNVVYVGGGDSNLYALDASTGAVIWKTSLGALPAHFIWDSPAVYAGSVYIGVASLCDSPIVQGQLFRLDASTGAVQNVLNLAPSGCTGAGVIASPTVDVADGSIYLATGNGGGCLDLGQAMVKVRAADLTVASSWTIPPAQAPGDSDFLATPTLFTATINGTVRPLVGSANKNGVFYAFDRSNVAAGPVWQRSIAIGGDNPEGGNGSIAPAAFDGGTLYVAGGSETINGQSCAGSIQALLPATGTVLWSDCLPGPVLAAPAVVPGLVVVGGGKTLFAFATGTGAELLAYTGSSLQVFYGAPTVSAGVVYATNMDGDLLAFTP